jgi:ubiquinone/menaquinone biosynthesis C-methylase UbiE
LTDRIDARAQAMLQWNDNPCGSVDGDQTVLEYFLAVERERYGQQSWQHAYFDFAGQAGQRVLEIGVGLGTDLVQFAKAGAECHGIDITDRHLELTSRNFRLRGLPVTLTKCDATTICYPDGYFDVVYSFGVLHHIPDAELVMREIRRVLKPGGRCLIALYNRWSAFHLTCKLMGQGIFHGDLRRLGYGGLLATIERGADGVTVKPFVRLYSRRTARRLAGPLRIDDISVHQLTAEEFWPSRLGHLLSPYLDAIEHRLGWYVTVKARKAEAAAASPVSA